MNQIEARERLSKTLQDNNAILVSPKEGDLCARTPISYLCGVCKIDVIKIFSNLEHGGGGGLCDICAKARGHERRIAALNNGLKWAINDGKRDFNRDLAIQTASKNGSTLLGIYRKEEDDSYTEIKDDNRINRDSYLHIKCRCGKKDYNHFRSAYGHGATGVGKGLCLCDECRKGHRAEALRRTHRKDESTSDNLIESMSKRAERIEKDGQECTDCKTLKPASEFARIFNQAEKCKVYNGRCYECSRELRTSNREDALRNGSVEEFMKGELIIAKDRIKKHNKKNMNHTLEFNITLEFLMGLLEIQDGKCAISGLPMLTTTHRDECPEGKRCNPNKLSIDRIDSSYGYTENNVQLVRWIANSMKMDMTGEEYKEEIRAQYENLHKPQPINEKWATLSSFEPINEIVEN